MCLRTYLGVHRGYVCVCVCTHTCVRVCVSEATRAARQRGRSWPYTCVMIAQSWSVLFTTLNPEPVCLISEGSMWILRLVTSLLVYSQHQTRVSFSSSVPSGIDMTIYLTSLPTVSLTSLSNCPGVQQTRLLPQGLCMYRYQAGHHLLYGGLLLGAEKAFLTPKAVWVGGTGDGFPKALSGESLPSGFMPTHMDWSGWAT